MQPEPVAQFTNDVIGSIMKLMNTAAKLLTSMRRNPLDWQISQLQSVARHYHEQTIRLPF